MNDDDGADPDNPGRSGTAIRSRHDWSVESASEAVVDAVAVAADRDPLSLDPLFERVDPEALDDLLSRSSIGRLVGGLCVTLRYEGFDVTVDGDGTVTIREADGRGGPEQ